MSVCIFRGSLWLQCGGQTGGSKRENEESGKKLPELLQAEPDGGLDGAGRSEGPKVDVGSGKGIRRTRQGIRFGGGGVSWLT